MTTAVYPGTFDPMTLGHFDIIERAASLFETLIVAVAATERKSPLLSLQQRLDMCTQACASLTNVTVHACSGSLVEFVSNQSAQVIVRGVRSGADTDYECQLAAMNRSMDNSIDTLLLPASPHVAFISGTMVRELLQLQSDVSAFVPAAILEHL